MIGAVQEVNVQLFSVLTPFCGLPGIGYGVLRHEVNFDSGLPTLVVRKVGCSLPFNIMGVRLSQAEKSDSRPRTHHLFISYSVNLLLNILCK
jgi:hypothetical protein